MRGVEYDERLSVPLRWWVQGTMLVACLWLAVLVALPTSAVWAVTGTAAVTMAAVLWWYGAARVQVVDGELRAGPAHIAVGHLGTASTLDPEAARRLAGPDAEARAYLLLRPYLKRAVRVEILDPADPTPYWLVATRRPEMLVSALGSRRRIPDPGAG